MTNNKPKIAISIGDLNGIGIEIALKCHEKISKICKPIYCINQNMLEKATNKLKITIPEDFELFEKELGYFSLNEIEQIKGSMGLSVERDISFQPTKLKDLGFNDGE